MSFTLVASAAKDHAAATSTATTSLTPALDDIAFIGLNAMTDSTGKSLTGGGMTWTFLTEQFRSGGNGGLILAYRATAGTPSAGALTYSQTNTFTDTTWAVVRPADLTYDGVAGKSTTGASTAGSLTVSLTTPAGYSQLCYGHTESSADTFATDTGWTELLDEGNAAGYSHQIMHRATPDTEVIIDPAATTYIEGVVLDFAPVTADDVALINAGRINSGLINSGLIR